MTQFCFVWKPIQFTAAIIQCCVEKNPSHVQLAILNTGCLKPAKSELCDVASHTPVVWPH